jgi:hypothetical protein
MNLYRVIALAVLILPATVSSQVIGVSPLTLHQNTSGQLIATVAGTVPACGLVATSADPTYTIAGNTITVTQAVVAIACVNPPPPDNYYIASVNFGRLFDGTYTVNWNIPQLTADYTITGNPGISAAFSGNWFDPTQSGQGFEIEILGGSAPQMSVLWFTFAPGGGETWIAASGPIDGTQASMDAYQITGPGAVFPPHFDAASVHAQAWGSLKFTFSDCNTGRVDWSSTQLGYGSGTMALTRLTMPDGLACP